MATEMITSLQNAKVKQLVALQQKSAERRRSGLFVVEGQRELEHCMDAGFEIDTLFYCPEIAKSPTVSQAHSPSPALPNWGGRLKVGLTDARKPFSVCSPSPVGEGRGGAVLSVPVSRAVYDKIAYRGGTEGVIATVRTKTMRLADLKLSESPLIVVLESVEKPGNLGAILRSADAAGADAVVVCDPLTDLFNPNLIRSSLGGIFSVPCVACTSQECIDFLKAHGIQILTAQLQDSHLYYHTDMCRPTAIVMGTESTGLTPLWRQAADAHIRIPMLGRLDSLNVSVSTAILLFEAVRQRQL